ncbi:MAG: FHA domain-containing protein, partial [Ilumatobacteraceae bacterium]
ASAHHQPVATEYSVPSPVAASVSTYSDAATVQRPSAAGPTLVLADGRVIDVGAGGVLGRDPAADPAAPAARLHPLADPSLSKTHLSFGPLPHGVWVLDHHSTNGTVVIANGVSVPCTPGTRVEAPFGTRVVAGDVSLTVGAR